jgi:hypothetical protein
LGEGLRDATLAAFGAWSASLAAWIAAALAAALNTGPDIVLFCSKVLCDGVGEVGVGVWWGLRCGVVVAVAVV